MNKWFETDQINSGEDASFRRLVITILVVAFVFVLMVLLLNIVHLPGNRIALIVADLLILAALVLALRGILLPGRIITPTVLFVAFMVINVFGDGNGIFDSSMIPLAAIVILAGLLLGLRGLAVFGILTGVSILLMGILDAMGIYTPKRPTSVTAGDIGVIVLGILGFSILTYLLIRRLTDIANQARRNEALQIESNRELQELQKSLELRISERTRELESRSIEFETIAEITRNIITIRDMGTMLNLAVELIRQRLGYYHVGIFLMDERGEYAELRAASSIAAAAMLEQRFKLRVGEDSLVGYVGYFGTPRIVSDVGVDTVHSRNPLLPDTRSEIGLPLRSGNLTIGVLDIQAAEPSAFDQQNIGTLQLLADELVAAIENAQLAERAERVLNELNEAYRAQTEAGWRRTIERQPDTALEYDGMQVRPVQHQLPASVFKQLEAGKAVVMEEHDLPPGGNGWHGVNTLLIPLMSLNQVVGVIGLEQQDPQHIWTPEEIAVAEATASRAAIALDNSRLLQEAQARSARERTIREISAKIGTLVDLDNIVQTAIEELSRNVPRAQIAIQFEDGNLISTRADSSTGD